MAQLADLRQHVEAVGAEIRRLRLENWLLRGELRRALSQEVIAASLHRGAGSASERKRGGEEVQEKAAEAPAPPAAPLRGLEAGIAGWGVARRGPSGASSSAAAASCNDVLGPSTSAAEADELTQRLQEEVRVLNASLRSKAELESLTEEVARMRELLAQPEDAWPSSALPPETREEGMATTGRCEGERCGVLLAEVSFEMLVTISEAELAEEKKSLQWQVRSLQRQLEGQWAMRHSAPPSKPAALLAAPALTGAIELRDRRRLQHMDAIACRLHEEFRRRTTASAPPSPWTPRSAPVTGAAGARCGLSLQAAPGSVTDRSRLSSPGKVGDLRAQRLEGQIQELSRRFLLLRDMR